MEAWPRRSLTTCRSAPPARIQGARAWRSFLGVISLGIPAPDPVGRAPMWHPLPLPALRTTRHSCSRRPPPPISGKLPAKPRGRGTSSRDQRHREAFHALPCPGPPWWLRQWGAASVASEPACRRSTSGVGKPGGHRGFGGRWGAVLCLLGGKLVPARCARRAPIAATPLLPRSARPGRLPGRHSRRS